MVAAEAVVDLCRAVEHVVELEIQGAIVECGVYRGGCMMAVALTLSRLGAERDLYLYDTFEGMPAPGDGDVSHAGVQGNRYTGACRASLEEVRANLESTGFDVDRIHYVAGRVEDTLPASAPESIALLRLDTDWYESTYHELTHLYPRLSTGGPLLIDDYGHWKGCRRAVDRYFAEHGGRGFLSRVSPSVRATTKPG